MTDAVTYQPRRVMPSEEADREFQWTADARRPRRRRRGPLFWSVLLLAVATVAFCVGLLAVDLYAREVGW